MNDALLLAWADRIGAGAWPGFLLVLALAICCTGVVSHRRALPSQAAMKAGEPRTEDAPRLGLGLAGGFVMILSCAVVFAVLASLLGDSRLLQRFDDTLSASIGRHTPAAVLAAFGLLTHFCEPLLLWAMGAGVALALVARRHRGLALVWVAALLGNGVLNRVLKEIFSRTRPLIDGLPGPASGFSFPSGHSSASMVAYAMLAWLGWRLLGARWRTPLAMAATAIILTTACSRVFLQVHFASDVLAGLCSGLAWTVVCITSAEHLRARRNRLSPQAAER